ncbi:hypothetical protein QSJ18_01585 [Gordonia sp. ABSL1-1]|uniref:hypothetical protein n=1 Tax=Gordonia sp. ABSL1-1 TaxID=3053923 RepID=UPI0025738BE8|nr:hypothetical protein [Gordonia sp. ABSL1-1]MDL9935429.1 hypothetical protein [Gordonia sp. ABSL1-1]
MSTPQSPYGAPQGQPAHYGQFGQGQPAPYAPASQPGRPAYPAPGYPNTPAYPAAPQGYPGPQAPAAPYPGVQRYPVGQPAVGAPQGLALTTEFFPLMWIFFFIKPRIEINGQRFPTPKWGNNLIPLPVGQHRVHVHVPYFLPTRVGPADIMIGVNPNQVVGLEYRAPLFAFSRGAIGPGRQPYNGVGPMIALTVIPIFLIFILAFLPLLLI